VIANCAPFFDYLSIHHYEDPRRFADGPRRYEDFFNQTARLIVASANPKIKLFVSEWNAQSTDWRTGLYAGGILNAMERTDAVEIASPALMLRHVSATAWDNSFINHDHRTWFPAPNYVVMKLFRDRYAPVRLATDGDPGPLNVVATRSDDARTLHLKAVNPSDAPVNVTLTLPANAYATATLDLVAPDALTARNTLDAPDAVKPASAPVTLTPGAARFTLPRWSVGVLTVRQADRPAPTPSDPPLKSPGSNVR
jgi:alpha-N-arabinofuranosidase